jgi:hypothetical protein
MPEFSNYVESLDVASDPTSVMIPVSKDGDAKRISDSQLNPFRGTYAGGTSYPSTNGRYTGGVPASGDMYALTDTLTISDGGSDYIYEPGTILMSLTNNPGNTKSNWAALSVQL